MQAPYGTSLPAYIIPKKGFKRAGHVMTSCAKALKRVQCESIETKSRKLRLLAGDIQEPSTETDNSQNGLCLGDCCT